MKKIPPAIAHMMVNDDTVATEFRTILNADNILGSNLAGVPVPDPGFLAPLTHSLIPTVASATAAYTFSRAATSTILDAHGVVKTVLSGEARFKRARRVENLVGADASEDLTDAWWTTFGAGVSVLATQITFSGAAGGSQVSNASPILTASDTVTLSATITLVSGAANLDLYIGGTTKRITVTSTPTRYSYTAKNTDRYVAFDRGSSDGVYTVEEIQVEKVTGQVDQSPAEYVTTDSGTDHGTNVTGVKYFNTELDNSVSAGGVVTESTGATITDCGYLSEQAKTNLVFPSGDPSDVSWTKANVTAPLDATQVLAGLVFSNITSSSSTSDVDHYIRKTVSITDNDFVVSAFATTGLEGRYLWIRSTSTVDATTATQFFDLQTGAVASAIGGGSTLTVVADTPKMEVVWKTGGVDDVVGYRCSLVFNQTAGTIPDDHTIDFGFSDADGDTSYSSLGTRVIGSLTGMQVQIDHEVGEYIPTTTGTETTAVDVLSYDVDNVTDIGESITMACDVITEAPHASIGNLMAARYDDSGTNSYFPQYNIQLRQNGLIRISSWENHVSIDWMYRQTTSVLPKQENKIAATFTRTAATRFTSLNGVEQTTPLDDETDVTVWTPDVFEIGCNTTSGTSQPDSIINNVRLYEALDIDQLKAIT